MIFVSRSIRYILFILIATSSFHAQAMFDHVEDMDAHMDINDIIVNHNNTKDFETSAITHDVENLKMDILDDDSSIDTFLNVVSLNPIVARKITAKSILGLLESMGAFPIIQEKFYLRTNPFSKRNVVDLPLWEIHHCTQPKRWTVGIHAFYNHMERSVFVDKNTNISSYINFNQITLFEKLNELAPGIKTLFPQSSLIDTVLDQTSVDTILALFKNFTVEQRRIGAMLHAWRMWKRCELRALLPLYYIERNIFAEPEERTAIEEQFGALDEDTQEKFQKNHAVSDKFGLGDFRIEADYALYKSDNFTFRTGACATIPIAFALKKGMIGSSFLDDNKTQPTFDLQSLFDLIPDDFNIASITDTELKKAHAIVIGDICKNKKGFLLGALDRFNAMLLDTGLGNNRHFGMGFIIRAHTLLSSFLYQFEWAKRFSFNNRASIEYLAPAMETRFFRYRSNPADYSSRNFNSNDEAEQESNLQFIQRELVNKFYPIAVRTKVQPGFIMRWTSRYCYCGDLWDITLGTDIWIQTKEFFDKYCTSFHLDQLDIARGKVPFAYQSKLFGSFALKWQRPSSSWLLSINAEDTLSGNTGIGKDWTVSINLETNF